MDSATVIVPIHNRLALTQKGIISLIEALDYYKKNSNNHLLFSVLVVDDGSSDGSAAWIKRNYPTIHILRGDGNLWWGGSINAGIQYAVHFLNVDLIVLWNDDTLCDMNYFTELEKLYSLNTKYKSSILGSKIFWIEEPNTLFNFGGLYSYKSGRNKLIGYNETDSSQFNRITQIDYTGGMGTVIPIDIVEKLNFFDVKCFPHYHADIDFFLRAQKAGYSLFSIPDLKIYNNRSSTGLTSAKNFKDLKKMLFTNHSHLNLKQNFFLNFRHSNTLLSWLKFIYKYFRLINTSLQYILFHKRIF